MASKAHCSKCGLKHERLVGVRCNNNLNQSVPIMAANSSDLVGLDDPDLPTPGQPCRNSGSNTAGSMSWRQCWRDCLAASPLLPRTRGAAPRV